MGAIGKQREGWCKAKAESGKPVTDREMAKKEEREGRISRIV